MGVERVCAGLCVIAAAVTLMAQSDPPPRFALVDVTKAAGITFTHQNGAFGKKNLTETLGAGVAFLDSNNDGRQHVLFVNGTTWAGQSNQPPS